jgi:hypothetical protein
VSLILINAVWNQLSVNVKYFGVLECRLALPHSDIGLEKGGRLANLEPSESLHCVRRQ